MVENVYALFRFHSRFLKCNKQAELFCMIDQERLCCMISEYKSYQLTILKPCCLAVKIHCSAKQDIIVQFRTANVSSSQAH